MCSVISVGMANALVLQQVVTLWDNNEVSGSLTSYCNFLVPIAVSQIASTLLRVGFATSFSGTCILMILVVVKLFGTYYSFACERPLPTMNYSFTRSHRLLP
jgi:hypothetical protein